MWRVSRPGPMGYAHNRPRSSVNDRHACYSTRHFVTCHKTRYNSLLKTTTREWQCMQFALNTTQRIKNKKPSCRWGTARARCQLKYGKMLHKCSTNCTWKGPATGEWPSRSFKITNTGAIRQDISDSLLVFYWKYVRFRDINICQKFKTSRDLNHANLGNSWSCKR